MRLEFRVLWFENQPQDVRTQVEEIKDYVREVGFVPRIDMELDGRNIESLSRQQRLYDDFDLVVVDYDLGQPGQNGDHVAQVVRQGFGFTDIIFYSGKPTVDLRRHVHEKHIDGVYCFERRQLADKLGTHIDQVVKRLSRLEAMRGLAVGTVSRCDDQLRALLSRVYTSAIPDQKNLIMESLDGFVAGGSARASEKYAKCKSFEERLASMSVTSFHLLKLGLAITKGNIACGGMRGVLGRYDEEVLRPRNTLGHALERRSDQGWEVTSHGLPAITHTDFPKLRKDMAIHLENICALRLLLVGQGGE